MTENVGKFGQEIDGWTWFVSPAVPAADGRIFTKILATDGEFTMSYVYDHPNISTRGRIVYESESWLSDLWLSPDGRLYAGGELGRIHISGAGDWQLQRSPARSHINSIWGPDDQYIHAVAEEGVLRHVANSEWSFVSDAQKLRCIRGSSRENIFAVGHRGLMVHHDGHQWRRIDVPTNLHLGSVWAVDVNTVYVVGPEGLLLVGGPDQWRIVDVGEIDLFDVAEYRGQVFIAAGPVGLFRLDGDNLVMVRDDINANRLSVGHGALCVSGGWSFHRLDGDQWGSYVYTFGADKAE